MALIQNLLEEAKIAIQYMFPTLKTLKETPEKGRHVKSLKKVNVCVKSHNFVIFGKKIQNILFKTLYTYTLSNPVETLESNYQIY